MTTSKLGEISVSGKPELWPGGYVRAGKRGKTYVIDRMVDGRRFHVSTRAHNITSAMKHYERFQSEPSHYRPSDDKVRLQLTVELCAEYRTHQLERKRVTREWANDCARYLGDWCEDLKARDLRKLEIHELKAAVTHRKTSGPARIIAIKGFFKWLRREKGLLKHAEDVTLDLPVPQLDPAKFARRKVVEVERVRAVVRAMPQPHQDVMLLLVGTAWHISEARRFAKSGEIVRSLQPGVLSVLVTRHKTKKFTRTAVVLQETLEAAKRIRARGRIATNKWLATIIRNACEKLGLATFTAGVMRHSVATWGIEAGADMATVSNFLDHESKKTTARWYVDSAHAKPPIPVMPML
jgi:integrase